MSPSSSVTTQALRPVMCVVAELHRDVVVADDAVAGWFVHAGQRLHLSTTPDWLHGGLPTDEEWRIEWVKLYEGLDLSHAFRLTGTASYVNAWLDLVESFCEQVPVGHDSSDVTARRIQNWIYAWSAFEAATPGVTLQRSGFTEQVTARLDADCRHLRANLTAERNHRTLELYALLIAGIALRDLVEPDLADWALAHLADNAATDIWADGVHRECSTDYHLIVLRSLLGAIANAELAGMTVPESLVLAAHRATEVAMAFQRPDGLTPALSDGDPDDHRTTLLLAADTLGRQDARWVATLGQFGHAPAATSATLAIGGYAVQRSGWGVDRPFRDESWLVFDVGPLGDGGHGHYDQLSVEAFAGGHPIVVDPGRFTYADTPDRHWFKGSAAHNTVTVDGFDQTPYRRGRPKGPLSQARLVRSATGDGFELLEGSVTSPCYPAIHTRTVMMIDGQWWLIHDRLRSPVAHRYRLAWHLPPSADSWSAGTGLGALAGCGVDVWSSSGDRAIEHGWYSPSYGVKVPSPVITSTTGSVADADFVTVLSPSTGAQHTTITVERAASTFRATVSRLAATTVVEWVPGTAHVTRTITQARG